MIEWRPHFTWSLGAVIDAEYQSDQDRPLGVTEAYLQYKPLMSGSTRFQARAGLFWPPVSMEHDGPFWSVSRTITPSAINSWIGEEVKGAGLEVQLRQTIGAHEFDLTAGSVSANDTAGTLLSFRGWSLSDQRATTSTQYGLPPLSPFLTPRQYDETTPTLELDNRVGYYVRADWRPPAPFTVNATYYDNEGDLISVDANKEWAWRTRFWNLGAQARLGDNTEILAQAMKGETLMGYPFPSGVWVYVEYESAYVLISHNFGPAILTGRYDAFTTRDEASPTYGDNSENGWALTVDAKRRFNDHATGLVEVMHMQSDRPSRSLAGLAARQNQTVVQASARLSF